MEVYCIRTGPSTDCVVDEQEPTTEPTEMDATVTDHNNGRYTVKYCGTYAGMYKVVVIVNDEEVEEEVIMRMYPNVIDPQKCTISKSKGLDALEVGSFSSFVLEARDRFGNLRHVGGEKFLVQLRVGGDKGQSSNTCLRGKIVDGENGLYTVSVKPTISGIFVMYVTWYGPRDSCVTFMKQELHIRPGPPAIEKSVVSGFDLQGVLVGATGAFEISSYVFIK